MEDFNSHEAHPGDFKIGSVESRAAARARLESAPPDIVLVGVTAPPKDLLGNVLSHAESEPWAEARGVRYEKLPGESLNELKARVLRDQPLGTWIAVHV